MLIRTATPADQGAIWSILEPVIRAGETYALPRDMPEAEALSYWMAPDHQTFVAVQDGKIAGTYFLCANQRGGGGHVANCGYMTSAAVRGTGRLMAEHSLQQARLRGFRAMQFNFVVGTNERAIALWKSLGFQVAGRLPQAFQHPAHGYVDALVMFREL
jgi:ribosomal protein S18 acetylase RimI-like enzyme